MIPAEKLLAEINRPQDHAESPRGYMGASNLGAPCSRELWYRFRWALASNQFSPRILRLFKRGDREESIFEKLLHDAGVEFLSVDPVTKKQYTVQFKNRHIGGHCDGIGKNLPDLEPEELFIGEWKTHNDKSFKDLVKKGVQESKPLHYAQMQLYMHGLKINWALYGAVNKNDDELHFELIPYQQLAAVNYLTRADFIIDMQTPPQRISENPGWYECRFCDFHSVCHMGAPLQETCRTCQHIHPLVDGDWWCGLHDTLRDIGAQQAGCPDHVEIK